MLCLLVDGASREGQVGEHHRVPGNRFRENLRRRHADQAPAGGAGHPPERSHQRRGV